MELQPVLLSGKRNPAVVLLLVFLFSVLLPVSAWCQPPDMTNNPVNPGDPWGGGKEPDHSGGGSPSPPGGSPAEPPDEPRNPTIAICVIAPGSAGLIKTFVVFLSSVQRDSSYEAVGDVR